MPSQPLPLSQCKSITLDEFVRLDKTLYAMEAKVDGWRIQMEVDPGRVTAWTRTNHDASGKVVRAETLLRLLADMKQMSFRLDGEVVYLDKNGDPDFNFTSRCMGSHTPTCVDKQHDEERFLSYVIFDVLRVDNSDMRGMPYEHRRGILDALIPEELEYVKVLDAWDPSLEQHGLNIEKFQEGSVLKVLDAPYAGKRHKSWLKLKETETEDVTIIGYKPGQGKFKDLIGAITFKAANGVVGNCSGMDDETRIYITDHKEALLGKVIEVKHYGLLVDGYRHPQFIRFRDE